MIVGWISDSDLAIRSLDVEGTGNVLFYERLEFPQLISSMPVPLPRSDSVKSNSFNIELSKRYLARIRDSMGWSSVSTPH